MYATCVFFLRTEGEKELEDLKLMHVVGGIGGILVLTTHLLQKHWDWQENRDESMKQGSFRRPTMYEASMDINTAFDVTRPKHIVRVVEDHIAAMLHETTDLKRRATF